MTEAGWLACDDPSAMLYAVNGCRTIRRRAKRRKQRLFAVACCRRLGSLLDEQLRRCIDVAERFADDRATAGELRAAEADAKAIWARTLADDAASACLRLCAEEVDGPSVSGVARSAVFKQQRRAAGEPFNFLDGSGRRACPSEERAHCALARDVFGNPFRTARAIRVRPAWRTGTVVALAATAYEERAFDGLPVLADALEEAGCDDPDVLTHLRADGPHVRGCWVVDLVLGTPRSRG